MEICALLRLEEFHVANNQLTSLPLEFGFLVNLEKLYLQKNKIRELPEVSYVKGDSEAACNVNINSLSHKNLKFSDDWISIKLINSICVPVHMSIFIEYMLKLVYVYVSLLSWQKRIYKLSYLIVLSPCILQSLGKCYKLRTVDIAANELRIFPTEVIQEQNNTLYIKRIIR